MKKWPHYQPEQFTATQWDSIEDKAKFANHFRRFVEKGYPQKLFYGWFYRRLSMTFGHIAHFNAHGFYDTFFTNDADKVRFLRQCDQYPCYGDPAFTYSDVEKALQPFIREQLRSISN